jgi:mono/diheme cytochrome c family protein
LEYPKLRCRSAIAVVALSVALAACRQDMHDAPRYEPFEASTFFTDGRASRTLVPNTIARGQLREDEHLYTGKVGGQLVTEFPMPVTAEVMARGRERFNVFCAPCHSRTGEGTGMIVQRGFRQPPSYYEERLVNAPVGYLFDVMTNGFGAMQDYSAQVPVADRWAIAAYIRALQFSRRGTTNDVPADRREELERSPVTPPPPPPPAGAQGGGATGQPAPAASPAIPGAGGGATTPPPTRQENE